MKNDDVHVLVVRFPQQNEDFWMGLCFKFTELSHILRKLDADERTESSMSSSVCSFSDNFRKGLGRFLWSRQVLPSLQILADSEKSASFTTISGVASVGEE